MKRLAFFALVLVSFFALAQAPTRVRGTITALDGDVLSVKSRDGQDLKVHLQPGSTMTNASLEGIAQVSGGNEITMTYKDGSQRILVPPGTPVVTFVPGTRADLKPGEFIFTTARNEGGRLVTQRVSVSKDGVKPPQ